MSRFWIYPRPLTISADRNAAIIDPGFGLMLKTEEQHADAQGSTRDAGRRAPLAERWAGIMPGIIEQDADGKWKRVDDFTTMLSVARTIRYRDAHTQAGLMVDWMLDWFHPAPAQVPAYFSGHPYISTAQVEIKQDDRIVTTRLNMPNCGGVELAVNIGPKTFSGQRKAVVEGYTRASLGSRKPGRRLYWDF